MADLKKTTKEKIKDNLSAKQLTNNKMLVTTEVDGITVYHKQDIGDIEIDKLERVANILKANVNTEKPVIKDKPTKIDKTDDITNFVNKAKGAGDVRDK